VYAVAAALGVPRGILGRAPTTDTFSLPQGQDEFYFALPYAQMDLALWSIDNGRAPAELATAIGRTETEAKLVYADIEAKRRAATYLHAAAETVNSLKVPG
jgi:NAD+ synthase